MFPHVVASSTTELEEVCNICNLLYGNNSLSNSTVNLTLYSDSSGDISDRQPDLDLDSVQVFLWRRYLLHMMALISDVIIVQMHLNLRKLKYVLEQLQNDSRYSIRTTHSYHHLQMHFNRGCSVTLGWRPPTTILKSLFLLFYYFQDRLPYLQTIDKNFAIHATVHINMSVPAEIRAVPHFINNHDILPSEDLQALLQKTKVRPKEIGCIALFRPTLIYAKVGSGFFFLLFFLFFSLKLTLFSTKQLRLVERNVLYS